MIKGKKCPILNYCTWSNPGRALRPLRAQGGHREGKDRGNRGQRESKERARNGPERAQGEAIESPERAQRQL